MTVGTIPQSSALTEVSIDSLAEAVSRFDRAISQGSLDSEEARLAKRRIIAGLREQRARWEATAATEPKARPREKGVKVPLASRIAGKLEDFGL